MSETVKQTLKSEDYYLDKLSMFLRQSPNVPDHFSMYISMMNVIDDVLDNFKLFLNVVDDDAFLKIEEMGSSSDILDKIGHLYGVKREFTLAYNEEGTLHTKTVKLNNFELWMLIKAQILQNCYDGSFKQMREYYDKMNIPVYIFSDVNSGDALILLDVSSSISVGNRTYTFEDNPNIEYLFRANLFTIKSMGIRYSTSVVSISNIAIWDSSVETRTWDSGIWGL